MIVRRLEKIFNMNIEIKNQMKSIYRYFSPQPLTKLIRIAQIRVRL